jgi:RNA polymerase sigma factor (sigma-70 family)
VTRKLGYGVRALREVRRFIGCLIHRSFDIADLSHGALMRACTAERNMPLEKPRAVLRRIANYQAVSRLERKAQQIAEYMDVSSESKVVEKSPVDTEIGVREMLGVHCAAVAGLIPQCRHVYLLRKVHGLSHKDIAAQLRITRRTVHEHLIRAIRHCDRYLRDKADLEGSYVTRWDQRDGGRSDSGVLSERRRDADGGRRGSGRLRVHRPDLG